MHQDSTKAILQGMECAPTILRRRRVWAGLRHRHSYGYVEVPCRKPGPSGQADFYGTVRAIGTAAVLSPLAATETSWLGRLRPSPDCGYSRCFSVPCRSKMAVAL